MINTAVFICVKSGTRHGRYTAALRPHFQESPVGWGKSTKMRLLIAVPHHLLTEQYSMTHDIDYERVTPVLVACFLTCPETCSPFTILCPIGHQVRYRFCPRLHTATRLSLVLHSVHHLSMSLASTPSPRVLAPLP